MKKDKDVKGNSTTNFDKELTEANNQAAFDECDLLEEKIDMEKVPYDVLQNTSTVFLKGIVKSLFNDELIKIDYYEYVMKVLNYANNFHGNGIGDPETLYKYRLDVWSFYKQYNNQEKRLERNLARLIVCSLYNEEDPTAQEELYFLYFDLLNDIHPTYCRKYRKFCEVDLKAYAYEEEVELPNPSGRPIINECDLQLNLLEKNIDVRKVPRNIIQNNFSLFLQEIMKTAFKDELISIDYYEYAMKVLNYASNYLGKGIGNLEQHKQYRHQILELHEQYEEASFERNLARLMVCCFYDEKESTGQEEEYVLYFELLNDTNPAYCKQYRKFCEVDLKAYSHEDKDGD